MTQRGPGIQVTIGFLSGDHGGQEKVVQRFSAATRKELSTNKTIFQDEGEIKTFLDEKKKKKRIPHQQINSENRTEVNLSSVEKMKKKEEEILEHQEQWKEQKYGNI